MPTATDRRDPTLIAAGSGKTVAETAAEALVEGELAAQVAEHATWFAREASRFPGMTETALRQMYDASPEGFYALIGRRTPELEQATLGSENDLPAEASTAEGRQWGQVYIGAADLAQWTALYPRLDDDGYQPPATRIQRAQVREFSGSKGYTVFPKGKRRPAPTFACDLPGAAGGGCAYRGYTDLEVIEHQAARHPRGYMAKQFSLQQRNSALEQQKSEALIAVMTKLAGQQAADAATPTALRGLTKTGA